MTHLAGVGVPDRPDAWESIGCTVSDGAVAFRNGALLLGRDGIVVDGDVASSDVDGVHVESGALVPAASHACLAYELDHLVLLTDSLDRTSAAVASVLGLPQRRVRETETVRQAFHRFADPPGGDGRGCIVEVVESERVTVTTLMGVVLIVHDLVGLAERFGPDVMSLPKAAVQPGRSIATIRRDVGLGLAVALMSP